MEDVEKIENAAKKFIEQRKLDLFFVMAGVLLGVYFGWNVVEILIFALFIWSILGPIPSRFLAFPALFFLVLSPILLVMERAEQAEEFSIYAYFFFIMTVIRAILEIREKKTAQDK